MNRKSLASTFVSGRSAGLWLIGLAAAMSGCATYDRTANDVERAVRDWQRRQVAVPSSRAAPAEARVMTPELSPAATSSPTFAANKRVQEHIRTALERHPSIKAAVAGVEAKLARIPQVTALPDPWLKAIVRPEPIQTAAGDLYFTLGVGQTIPLPAKLDRAGRIAAAEVRMAIEQLNATRLRIISDVERAYAALYLMDRNVELTAANRALLEDLARVVHLQYEVGAVPQQDLLRVQTAVAKLRDDENRYRLRRMSAAATLNQLMDYSVTTPQPTTESLHSDVVQTDVEGLLRLAEQHSPELARLTEQVRRDEQRVALARLGYWPEVTLGVEWSYVDPRMPFVPPANPQTGVVPPYNRKSAAGDDNWALSVQFNLPIWSQRIKAAKREARHNLLRTQHELQSQRSTVALRIYDAWTRVQTQQETVRLLESTLIPEARQTYEVTLTAYQAGKTDFLDVIDSWRRRLDFELMLQRETVDLETAFSDLQREVGLQLFQMSQSPTVPASEE